MKGTYGKNGEMLTAEQAAAATTVAVAAQPAAATAAAAPANGKVLFEVGKSALPAVANDALKPVVEYAKANPSAKLFISGFTDKTGDPAKNAELAKERAKAVRESLKAAGVIEDRIEMRKPEVSTGTGNNEEARRVEVGIVGAAAPAAAEALAPAKMDMAALKTNGEKVFAANCVACHQTTGMGVPGAFPALNKSKVVNGAKADQLALLLNGKPGTAMASFARLSDDEIASVITYTRNAWDNKVGDAVQPADVKAARK